MVDNRTPESRSALMSRIGPKNTAPEMIVRRLLHKMGYRFRLHRKDLPGKPDIVLPGRKAAIFVHGCYWHGHGCSKGRLPKSNVDYWQAKIEQNRLRDQKKSSQLEALGWQVLTIWQCELKDICPLAAVLQKFVEKAQKTIDKSTNVD
jgi:DNA mismatch endonuclease (patch repair protein)